MLLRNFAAASFILVLAGCNGGNFLGPNTTPSGNINLINAQTQQSIISTKTNPLPVSGGFTINATEANFNNAFTVSIVSFSNPTNYACFTVSEVGSTQSYLISPTNAAAPGSGNPNPCVQGDIEEVQFTDNRGNSAVLWYSLTTTLAGTTPNAPATTSAPSA